MENKYNSVATHWNIYPQKSNLDNEPELVQFLFIGVPAWWVDPG